MSFNDIKGLKTINEVDEYRRKMNEECDKRAALISLYKKAGELSEKDFGTIKESFEAISPELFKTKDGQKIMGKYTSAIKSSKNLSSLHTLYENIRKAGKDSDIDFLVNEIANTDWGVSKASVDNDCKKLGRILAEGYILVGEKSPVLPSSNEALSKAVYFIAENKKSQKNISDYSAAIKVIRENISLNEKSINPFDGKDLDSVVKEAVENFNKKYSSQLNEGEIEALKKVSSFTNAEEREKVFEEYKENCRTKLIEAKSSFEKDGNEQAASRISSIIEQVEGKTFNSESLGNDVCNLIELSNIFE